MEKASPRGGYAHVKVARPQAPTAPGALRADEPGGAMEEPTTEELLPMTKLMNGIEALQP